ncbi:MAG TPA: histidine kinase [Chitinophagaceae bacterium]|jgi:sensor histidine kinase YesM|nr:histidine kinase [Chitinophagaceae bacterium]
MTIFTVTATQNMGMGVNFMSAHMKQHPFIFSDERKWRIRRHLAFWVFWWLFQGFLYSFIVLRISSDYFVQLPVSIMESFFFMVNHIFLAYGLMYFVIPRFLLKQRYLQTAAWTLLLFFFTACLSTFMSIVVIPPVRELIFGIANPIPFRPRATTIFLSLLAGLRGGITIGGIAAAIKLMKYWYVKEQRNLQLQNENTAAQLQLLKAQVHPHFLFNTLNNIYSYTQTTAPVAAGMVSGLSDLLRFMLYEGTQPLVPLAREITMVKDYISLEKIRYGNKLELHLDLPSATNDLYIAPLLLLPLVENCFKHGTSNMLEQPWINLQISIRDKQMQMKLINGKAVSPGNNSPHKGIGIQNVEKRLSLLYPGKYELIITEEEEVFIVNLKIELETKKMESSKSLTNQPVHA